MQPDVTAGFGRQKALVDLESNGRQKALVDLASNGRQAALVDPASVRTLNKIKVHVIVYSYIVGILLPQIPTHRKICGKWNVTAVSHFYSSHIIISLY